MVSLLVLVDVVAQMNCVVDGDVALAFVTARGNGRPQDHTVIVSVSEAKGEVERTWISR
jgi:hypothetical protein